MRKRFIYYDKVPKEGDTFRMFDSDMDDMKKFNGVCPVCGETLPSNATIYAVLYCSGKKKEEE